MAIEQVSAVELKEIMATDKTALVIDVREEHEFQAYHVPDAALWPLSTFNASLVIEGLQVKSPQQHIYVLCEVGGRAMQACSALFAAGHEFPVLVQGGTQAWAAEGFPLAAG